MSVKPLIRMARAGGGTNTNEDETDDCDDMNPSCLFNEVCHRVAVLYACDAALQEMQRQWIRVLYMLLPCMLE